MQLDGKSILVTGAASGIGRSIAVALARRGASVAAADLREPTDTVQAIRDGGGTALGLTTDISDSTQVRVMD